MVSTFTGSCETSLHNPNRHLRIEWHQWDDWIVTEACPITISINGSYVTAVCQNGYHKHGSSHKCHQVNYCHKPESSRSRPVSCVRGHPVGCVSASRISVKVKEQPVRDPLM
jgi:hypothetical protein